MTETFDYIVLGLMAMGLLFTVIRFIKGPRFSDRVISLDTFNMIVIGVIAVISMLFESALYLDIVIVYAILAFLENIVFARWLEGRNHVDF